MITKKIIMACVTLCFAVFLGVASSGIIGEPQTVWVEFEDNYSEINLTIYAHPFSSIKYKSEDPELEYDILKIQQEVMETAQKYFKGVDFDDVYIFHSSMDWEKSFAFSVGFGEGIMIGWKYLEDNPERYRWLFTHEYTHFLLHPHGLKDMEIGEGIADVYSTFVEREEQAELFGSKNRGRNYPYTMFTNQILEQDNFDCLYNVFNEEDKIESLEEILTRLENWCGVVPEDK